MPNRAIRSAGELKARNCVTGVALLVDNELKGPFEYLGGEKRIALEIKRTSTSLKMEII